MKKFTVLLSLVLGISSQVFAQVTCELQVVTNEAGRYYFDPANQGDLLLGDNNIPIQCNNVDPAGVVCGADFALYFNNGADYMNYQVHISREAGGQYRMSFDAFAPGIPQEEHIPVEVNQFEIGKTLSQQQTFAGFANLTFSCTNH
jgi:hypothetical protein